MHVAVMHATIMQVLSAITNRMGTLFHTRRGPKNPSRLHLLLREPSPHTFLKVNSTHLDKRRGRDNNFCRISSHTKINYLTLSLSCVLECVVEAEGTNVVKIGGEFSLHRSLTFTVCFFFGMSCSLPSWFLALRPCQGREELRK